MAMKVQCLASISKGADDGKTGIISVGNGDYLVVDLPL
jgi:hypothetical protein